MVIVQNSDNIREIFVYSSNEKVSMNLLDNNYSRTDCKMVDKECV